MLGLFFTAIMLLSGCMGGSTYGTGVTQEKQTLDDLSNMLTFKKPRPKIDYGARPDLVIPNNKQLATPVNVGGAGVPTTNVYAANQNPDQNLWPETPEERLARIRAEADAAGQSRQAQKKYEQNLARYHITPQRQMKGQEAPEGQGIPNVSCDPDGKLMRKCTSDEISRAVRQKRQQMAYGTGPTRKYLTEPPIEYRQASAAAPQGDLGYTEEELKRIEEEKRLEMERASK